MSFFKKEQSEPQVDLGLEPGETVLKKTDKYRGNVTKGTFVKKGETMMIYLTDRRLIMVPSAWTAISGPSLFKLGEGTINIQLKDVTKIKKSLQGGKVNVETGGETYTLDFGGILNPKWLDAISEAADAAKR
jgi:outer membrane lipoprotein-sorting protein